MKKLKFTNQNYKPFLPPGIYKIVGYYKKNPLVVDRTGFQLRLNRRKDYQLI